MRQNPALLQNFKKKIWVRFLSWSLYLRTKISSVSIQQYITGQTAEVHPVVVLGRQVSRYHS